MSSLTLSFKKRLIGVYQIEEEETLVGRDPSCKIRIDSLAVAPRHASIRQQGDQCQVRALNNDYPVQLNHNRVVEAILQNGDRLEIGKHSLLFSVMSAKVDFLPRRETGNPSLTRAGPTDVPEETQSLFCSYLEILNGKHRGRSMRLSRALTRMGKIDAERAVIARRNDGCYLAHLQGKRFPLVNERSIGERTQLLMDGDLVQIGDTLLQFFSRKKPMHEAGMERRRFQRILFDAPAELRSRQGRFQSSVIDISLKGLLLKRPTDWKGDPQGPIEAIVKLDEDGTRIHMNVSLVHEKTDCLGFRCQHIDVDGISHLRRLVELNLDDPDLLERELDALVA